MGDLPSKLQYVASTADLTRAITIMVRHNFSQVAVIDDNGTDYGKAHVAKDPTTRLCVLRPSTTTRCYSIRYARSTTVSSCALDRTPFSPIVSGAP
ncbi:hypothetical protein ACWDSJ_06135 [Nocardia sp. NPDC003482]